MVDTQRLLLPTRQQFGKLSVHLYSAYNLPKGDFLGRTSDPYTLFFLGHLHMEQAAHRATSRVVPRTLNPTWDEELVRRQISLDVISTQPPLALHHRHHSHAHARACTLSAEPSLPLAGGGSQVLCSRILLAEAVQMPLHVKVFDKDHSRVRELLSKTDDFLCEVSRPLV